MSIYSQFNVKSPFLVQFIDFQVSIYNTVDNTKMIYDQYNTANTC